MKASKALDLLDELIDPSSNRRTGSLLMEPNGKVNSDWFIALPNGFIEALNIKYTNEWTQGPMFEFASGDVMYDSPKAHEVSWCEALKDINLRIEVLSAKKAHVLPKKGRSPGTVTFKYFKPNKKRTQLNEAGKISLTQDEFVRLVIGGPTVDLCPELLEKEAQIELL